MKISIFSDCHTGFAYGEERGEDSFKGLEECIERSKDSDLILIAGDLFDVRIPKPEVLAKTARILSKAQHYQSKAKLIEILNKEKHEISPSALRGIPILTIHGNHERRAKYLINPVQAMEHAGLLIYLNHSTAIFEIDGQRIAVHGMSNVPEQYSREFLREWNPRPIEGATNIFMFHQNVGEYIYTPLEPPSMVLDDLPKGFDLYVLGHIHWSDKKPFGYGQFLLTGSTTPTNIHKVEGETPKYLHVYDGQIQSFPLDSQRKIIWKDFEFEGGVREKIENFLTTIPLQEPKPIAFVKIKGMLPRDMIPPNFSDIEEKFKDRVIVNLNKTLEVEGFEEQIELLRMLRDQRLSPEEHGLKILQELLKQNNCKIRIEEIFDYLIHEETEMAFDSLFK